MFEEEAEEWADKLVEKGCVAIAEDRVRQDIQYTFRKGAEFGYNKAKEEMQEQGLALQSDMDKTIEQNIALKKELEKANEWHYVKDGDFPPEDTKVLALMAGGEVCIAHFYRKNVWDKIGIVIAWKEIVLPKEIEK